MVNYTYSIHFKQAEYSGDEIYPGFLRCDTRAS